MRLKIGVNGVNRPALSIASGAALAEAALGSDRRGRRAPASSARRPRSTTRGCAPSSPVAWRADCPAAGGRDEIAPGARHLSRRAARAECGRALSATPRRSLASTSARSRAAPSRIVDRARRRRGRGPPAGGRSAPTRRAGRERASRSSPAGSCARRRSAVAPAPSPPPRRTCRRTDGAECASPAIDPCITSSSSALSRTVRARAPNTDRPSHPRAPAGSRRGPGSASFRRVRSTRRGSGSIRRRRTRSRTAPSRPRPPPPSRPTIRPACGSGSKGCE